MATPTTERMRQVHLGLGSAGYAAVSRPSSSSSSTDEQQQQQLAIFAQEHAAHEAMLLAKCPPAIWPHGSYRASCPRPILVTRAHCQQLTELHAALAAALNDIVPRWWRDEGAGFPQRMPLAAEEEGLLKWLDEQQDLGRLAEFAKCQGSWRPDFLIEEVRAEDGTCAENFRLSEINARFCFNGFMHISYGSAALEDMGMERSGLVAATDGAELFEGLLDLFQHDKPLHLLKGEEAGIDIQMFIHAVRLRLGTAPRLITPSDLRLAPDQHGNTTLCCLAPSSSSPSSTLLYTTAGEAVEEIHQVGVELHQRELLRLDPEVWRLLSLRCFNDMRTVLLVHDKRMLGIILQELPSLLARGVVTPAQAAALNRGIAHTILPGSAELQTLLRDDSVRDEYLLKPVRGGKGAGILFGEEMTAEDWRAAVTSLLQQSPSPAGAMVMQRRVRQQRYDVVLRETGEVGHFPLVGTYHVVNGRYLGIGIWRSSGERICAVSTGGSWMCSVMSP
ncbi:hypothetical protein LMH87_002131 [Akanthomyces muscarius]|uniref:Uncharacterized protein n=1 Tax=Akanthomyces muscarius TaxID=2231603 RepID=A0A9W8Q744_AKAMU|nr:hypothetical protein LMH87_002131 [Akanthomyces muscarius]KAJ4147619.1 hypothetical protein LMH87_002131 [Akanthomyces muscarius]